MFFNRKKKPKAEKSKADNTDFSSGVASIDTWDQFLLDNHPETGFMQSGWWAHYMNQRGWAHFGAILRDGDEILGGARVFRQPFSETFAFYYLPEAPVLPADASDAEQVFDATLQYLETKRKRESSIISHSRLELRWPTLPGHVKNFRTGQNWLEPRNTLQVDLTLSEAEILAQMKPKGRYNIKLAKRHGVNIVQQTPLDGMAAFEQIHSDTARRQGMRGEESAMLKELAKILTTENRGVLLFAMLDGEPIAAALLVFFANRATYLFGGSLDSQRRVMAPYLLHFEAMLEAQRRGHTCYDFYGTAPPDQPDHAWAGISAFKRKFGGEELAFVQPIDYVYDEAGYSAYQDYALGSRLTDSAAITD